MKSVLPCHNRSLSSCNSLMQFASEVDPLQRFGSAVSQTCRRLKQVFNLQMPSTVGSPLHSKFSAILFNFLRNLALSLTAFRNEVCSTHFHFSTQTKPLSLKPRQIPLTRLEFPIPVVSLSAIQIPASSQSVAWNKKRVREIFFCSQSLLSR